MDLLSNSTSKKFQPVSFPDENGSLGVVSDTWIYCVSEGQNNQTEFCYWPHFYDDDNDFRQALLAHKKPDEFSWMPCKIKRIGMPTPDIKKAFERLRKVEAANCSDYSTDGDQIVKQSTSGRKVRPAARFSPDRENGNKKTVAGKGLNPQSLQAPRKKSTGSSVPTVSTDLIKESLLSALTGATVSSFVPTTLNSELSFDQNGCTTANFVQPSNSNEMFPQMIPINAESSICNEFGVVNTGELSNCNTIVTAEALQQAIEKAFKTHSDSTKTALSDSFSSFGRELEILKNTQKQCQELAEILKDKVIETPQQAQRAQDSHVIAKLPLQTPEDVAAFETLLSEEDNKKDAVVLLAKVGGSGVEDTTKRILKRMMSNWVASDYSWQGKKKKKSFEKSPMKDLLMSTVQLIEKNATEKEIEVVGGNWLKFAPFRNGGKKKINPQEEDNNEDQ